MLFNLAITKDSTHFHAMNLNRGLLFGLNNLVLKTVNLHRQVQNCELPVHTFVASLIKHQTHSLLGAESNVNLYALAEEIQYWDNKAHWFKGVIVQKYIRLALMQAQSTYKQLAHSEDLSDISQVYLVYVSKAIDRCDARQGVLTTFIQSWLKSAKAECAKGAKEALHSSYDSMVDQGLMLGEAVLPDNGFEALEHLSAIAKDIDREGYVRASLGIPEFLNSKQRALLLRKVKNG